MNENLILKIKQVADLDPVDYIKQGDAGIDLRASGVWITDLDRGKGNERRIEQDSYELLPQDRVLALSGIEAEIPDGYYVDIRDRSGNALYHGLHVLAGVVDSNYRGEIGILLTNLGKRPYVLSKNERIAQMIVTPAVPVKIELSETLTKTERGEQGFGSTGKY